MAHSSQARGLIGAIATGLRQSHFFVFLGPHPAAYGGSQARDKIKLQLPATVTATAIEMLSL